MKVTLKDVAEAVGVSATTVSTVLHGTGVNVRVSEETAAKVREVALSLRYQPNTVARSLRYKRTNTVGIVFQHFERLSEDNPYHPQLLNGAMAALFKAGYTLALCPTLVQGDRPDSIWDGRFDGVLWARPDFTEASLAQLKNSAVPLVMMHAPPGSTDGVPTFVVDNEKAMTVIVEHLAGLGHRSITFVVDEINEHTAEGRARWDAFFKAAVKAGIEPHEWVWDERALSLERYRSERRSCSAMAVFSDALAGRLLQTCRQIGVIVPRDLSVVGFDSSTFCERTLPRLTSIHQPVEQIAYDATNYLISLIQAGHTASDAVDPLISLYECGLDVRDSTARPSPSKII